MMAQLFYGIKTRLLAVYGMKTESEFPQVYRDFLTEHGFPHTLAQDNAKSEKLQKNPPKVVSCEECPVMDENPYFHQRGTLCPSHY